MMSLNRNYMAGLVIAFLVGVTTAVGGLTMMNRVRPAPIVIEPPEPTARPRPSATPGPVRVYVNGQVAAPAVYKLSPGSLVEDAITAAGGWTAQANTDVVNLAQALTDGMQIYVPSLEETAAAPQAVLTIPTPVVRTSGGIDVTNSAGLVNINTAEAAELDALPGIGPSTAQKILDFRDENGLFNTVEEIMNVSGIGEAKFGQIKELITVGG